MRAKSKTKSRQNHSPSYSTNVACAKKKLLELRKKIQAYGIPPHADFWHQSLYEAEERLRRALACQLIPEEVVSSVTPAVIEHAYSINGEDWTADWCSFIDQNQELSPGDECKRGEMHYAYPAEFVDSDSVINFMSDNASSSDLGAWAEDFPSVSTEVKQKLEDLLSAWARKNCDCSFYRVKNIETFKITHEDLNLVTPCPP